MLTKKKRMESKGFTIIEVMIVLAIAGLILLIVLLAVPALQRNARNTTIKNDASALAAGFSEYASNNNGALPASISFTSPPDVVIGATGSSQANAKVSGSTNVTVKPVTGVGAITGGAYSTLYWETGTSCNGNANPRAVGILYYPETSAGLSKTSVPACIDAS